jgi:hypothetical protein
MPDTSTSTEETLGSPGVMAAQREKEPRAVSLFAFKPVVRAYPENRYAG